jgi:hypothetical protein
MIARFKAFTPIDVLVIVLLCVLLLLLLPPVVHMQRGGAFRMTCGTNLSRIGKAMLLYANDYDDELPRAGGRNSIWAPVNWCALTRGTAGAAGAYGTLNADGTGGNCTISSCFYLLIKYAEATPKSFLCTDDPGVSEWTLSQDRRTNTTGITEITQAWDFGANPQKHCSYTYHAPWGKYALTTKDEPGFAVAADRNPWMASPGLNAKLFPGSADGKRTFQGKAGSSGDQMYGNSAVHQGDGQNVMFLDTHVTFEKRAYCGWEDDNIYTISTDPNAGDPLGIAPAYSPKPSPANRKDSVLAHDPPLWPATHP